MELVGSAKWICQLSPKPGVNFRQIWVFTITDLKLKSGGKRVIIFWWGVKKYFWSFFTFKKVIFTPWNMKKLGGWGKSSACPWLLKKILRGGLVIDLYHFHALESQFENFFKKIRDPHESFFFLFKKKMIYIPDIWKNICSKNCPVSFPCIRYLFKNTSGGGGGGACPQFFKNKNVLFLF